MKKGKEIGYKRVSTTEQNPDRQLEGLTLDRVFTEYASGGSMKRPVLHQMMEYVRDDDTIYVHSMDRLARNLKDLRSIIDKMIENGVSISFVKENLTFTSEKSPMSDLLLCVMGAVAEFELSIIRERQLEGIALAKKAGKYKGRKRVISNDGVEKLKEIIGNKRQTKAEIAKQFGVSLTTFYKYKRLIEKESA